MSQDDATSSAVCMAKIIFANLPTDWKINDRLQDCFRLFLSVLPFESPTALENFFRSNKFEMKQAIWTFYGCLKVYDISHQLQQMALRRDLSLRRLCALRLGMLPSPYMTLDRLLALPVKLLREFFIMTFAVLWLPTCHVIFHNHTPAKPVPDDLKPIFNLLTNPYLFERMYDACRDLQLFLMSWLQHTHFHSISGISDQAHHCMNMLSKQPDQSPLVQPHHLSLQLISNSQEILKRASRLKQNTAAEVAASALLGLKVANFLCDSSEYVHAFKAAQMVHGMVRTFFGLYRYHRTQLRLEYEAMCIMLRAMNAYNMYLTPEDQNVFLKQAPNLLQSMKALQLLLLKTDLGGAVPQLILPISLKAANAPPPTPICLSPDENEFDGVSCDNDQPAHTDPITSSGAQTVSPTGDSCDSSTQDYPMILPPPHIPDSYFPSPGYDSPSVAELLNESSSPCMSAAYLHAQLANYHYAMCRYQTAYEFTLLAIEQLHACSDHNMTPSPQVVVEVLRIMCKICMIKRSYDLGLRIIRRALFFTKLHFGIHNLVYANLLLEYGCLMLNTDKTRKAARVYRVALALVLNCLPGASIMAALALEAIAYAHYVLEYTSGDFTYALNCAEMAGLMLRRLNHEVCTQAASANRVRALIIEEIAIDDSDATRTNKYLNFAKALHTESLDLCERTFGLWNIQTAKHFGNLGRLYQSMQDNKEAERMHRKAIMIKERLLGSSDFEVGLSVGHLASLYNYDMDRFKDAEQLYLRSIQISLDLFGPTYSGLEYDYRGLQRVYHELGNRAQMKYYQNLFDKWRKDRQRLRLAEPVDTLDEIEPIGLCESEADHWCSFFDLAKDYEFQFRRVFNCFGTEAESSADSPCTDMCLSGGLTSIPEASRSTGH
ncbi:unnamed protein product [Calicophoron daubneyi]|uniref:Amyloid protein-binding protein 2 n=1 Tax=Calicophoron daubneyi TaxID=300641 RepID=A0AAV2T182_CALDB